MTLRSAFVATVTRLLDEDESVVLMLGDISVYAFREAFARHPTRCFNMGVCEQASVGMAAGLAASGLYPIYHTISSFLCRRAYEQIYLDFGVQRLPGLFVGVGGAHEYVKLGPTHCAEDERTLMKCVHGMAYLASDDEEEVERDLRSAVYHRALAYIRLEERVHGLA